ncbi:hypothetical protein [Streptomyces sp. NPDC005485]|uniref:hypothetical protein n=1 Tax=Streptomyces sp. NPDC005485 TaxID=3155591 RepID=UPI0033A1AC49
MNWLAVAGALVFTALGALGVVTLTTGRVAPWGRGRVVRPRLWGYGSLVAAVGGALFLFLGPLSGPPHGVRGAVAWGGWAVFMAGLTLQYLAQRPGRRTPRPARTAS